MPAVMHLVFTYMLMQLNQTNSDASTDSTSLDDMIMLGKMASLGFKIKHGFSYHGIAINLNCDLSAFNAINPCGYAGMQMLRLSDFVTMNKRPHPQPDDPTLTDEANDDYAMSKSRKSSSIILPSAMLD